jgi:acetyl-CoA acetyltransferase
MRGSVAVVGYGRTPYTRLKPGEQELTVDEYIAWAAELALQRAGMTKNDFDGQGLAISHSEVAHTVNWAAACAENLGISPKVLLRGDQGGASAGALLIRAAAMIESGIVDRVLVIGADTPLSMPSIAPGLPLSPERSRGIFWDFQAPFGVMGATAQFGLIEQRYRHQYTLSDEQLAKVAVTTRYHASLHPGAIYRKPITADEYIGSRVLSAPMRLLDCVPIVNGGLAFIVTSAKSARSIADRPVYLLGFGEVNNYYHGSRTLPDITYTGFVQCAPEAFGMAGIRHSDVDLFQPYDDFPFVVMMQLEDCGFCKKGEGGKFVEEHDLRFNGDFPLSTDGGQLSGGQPGGAVGGFSPIIEVATQLRGEAGERQVQGVSTAVAIGFGGIPYARPGRSCVTMIFGTEA